MLGLFGGKNREPGSYPLEGSPPADSLPCKPTLILGLSAHTSEDLEDVIRNDLVYASTSRARSLLPGVQEGVLLYMLRFLESKSLFSLTKAVGGTRVVDMEDLYDDEGEVRPDKISSLRNGRYQAIICADYSLSEPGPCADFVQEQYQQHGVSVVVMAIEGLFDMSYMQRLFGINWRLAEYTARSIQLSDVGTSILSRNAFPQDNKYAKAHYVVGDGEALFLNWTDPEEEEDSDSDERDPIPQPGSPVMVHLDENKSISFFGFVNSLDVSFGAIILRLCYAAQHFRRTPPL